jgi:hypothetical protein
MIRCIRFRLDQWRGPGRSQVRRKQRRTTMDMNKYASSSFMKPEDLANGPRRKTITSIEEGRYDKPVAIFDDTTRLSLNGTNVSTLIRAFGRDGDDWIGREVELYAGMLRYNANDNPAVLVRAINPSPAAAKAKPQQDLDDEVPFR